MPDKIIAVLAGTPTDTQMGVNMITRYGYKAIGGHTASCGNEQHELQSKYPERLRQITLDIIRAKAAQGAEAALIYCNSLSVVIDLDALKHDAPIPIITPVDAHIEIARKYRRVGLLAVTAGALAGLENVYISTNYDDENFDNRIMGCTILPLVMGIERQLPASELLENHGLVDLCEGMAKYGAQCIVLGCTHLPYIEAELSRRISLPVINPDDILYEILKKHVG